MTPIRHRRDELPALVEAALTSLFPGNPPRAHRETIAVLRAQDYPGNLDELLGILQTAGRRSEGRLIRPEHLPEAAIRQAYRRRRARQPGAVRQK